MESKVLLVLVGMSLVTYIPRVLPITILSKMDLPSWFITWLRYIPIAVLSALLAPILFVQQGRISLGLDNKALLASLPCFLVAYKTKNLFLTVLTGIVVMFLLNLI